MEGQEEQCSVMVDEDGTWEWHTIMVSNNGWFRLVMTDDHGWLWQVDLDFSFFPIS